MKKLLTLFTTLIVISCSHAKKESCCGGSAAKPEEKTPVQAKGYGDFLFMPPDSIAIRNFVDKDGDQVDDRYQMAPGTPGLPMGHYYKKKP
jgi:hypothetical protein